MAKLDEWIIDRAMKPLGQVAIFGILTLNILAIGADTHLPAFRAVEIDAKIQIGYGIAVADVDGDNKPDILLADKKQIVWYRNPNWEKFVIAEDLTKLDNVCIAAADINADGKARWQSEPDGTRLIPQQAELFFTSSHPKTGPKSGKL